MSEPGQERDETRCPAVTRYRIAPWPVRILIPFAALVLIAGIVHDRTAPVVLIPLVLVVTIAYLFAADRIGVYCSANGLESRMTRRANSFRYGWSEIDRFDVAESSAIVAIVVELTNGTRRVLPATKTYRYQRTLVSRMCDQLNREALARN